MNYSKVAICVVLSLFGVATMYGADEGWLRIGWRAKKPDHIELSLRAQRVETRRAIKHQLKEEYGKFGSGIRTAREYAEVRYKILTNRERIVLLTAYHKKNDDVDEEVPSGQTTLTSRKRYSVQPDEGQEESKQDSPRITKCMDLDVESDSLSE